MAGKKIILYVLAAFLAGNLLLIYIQYNSVKNVNNLINGNEKVIREMSVSTELRELERNITSVESKIGNSVYTKDSSSLTGLSIKIGEIQANIDSLQKISDDDNSVRYIDTLDLLVHEKLLFGNEILHAYRVSGKDSGGKLINSERARTLNESIVKVIRLIRRSRQDVLAKTTESIDNSGKKARNFGTALIALVLAGGIALFWLVINTIRKQMDLIRQLHISEQQVKEASRVKDYFMANMSHEIRTPMNAILGFTGLLQKKNLDDASLEYVQTIQDSGERLLAIIDDVLDLSKIEAGMMRIESAPFGLRGLLRSVIMMFQIKLEEKQLQFYFEIDDSLPDTLGGDATRLTQILVNLIGNAVKFTAAGSVSLDVSNRGMSGDEVKLGITVCDTGIGIDEDKQQHIFERFHQGESSVTRIYGGTGLGLSIVKDLIELQHGFLRVESQPGKGTAFLIELPYKILPTTPRDRPAADIHTGDLSGARLLVVEDHAVNQDLIKQLFKNRRLEYDLAVNGQEAVDMAMKKTYDLILMDIQMPVMDGYTATQKIREAQISTPIVAMTAHALAGEREKCIGYGMNDYLSKPIRDDRLFEIISRLIRENGQLQSRATLATKPVSDIFRFINLDYMREISAGDQVYERTVTEQFIESIPDDLSALENAWRERRISELQQCAHNMKTTVAVMGLDQRLEPFLNTFEYGPLDETSFYDNYTALKEICEKALAEARLFYHSIT